MLDLYTPLDWYWGPNDTGLYFASARQTLVPEDDAGFTVWREARGYGAAQWPRDDAGAQTSAALNAMLRPYGLSTAGRVRTASVSALLDTLSASQRATITQDHMSRLVARAATGPVVPSDPKVGRAATDIGITPDAWFTLAGA